MLIVICDAFDASLPEKLTQFGEVTTDISSLPEANFPLLSAPNMLPHLGASSKENLFRIGEEACSILKENI